MPDQCSTAVPDSDDEDDTSLTYAYVCLVVRVQGLGRGWLVRKHARLANLRLLAR